MLRPPPPRGAPGLLRLGAGLSPPLRPPPPPALECSPASARGSRIAAHEAYRDTAPVVGRGPRSALHMGAPAPRPARTYISTWAPKGSGVRVFRDGYGCPGTGPRRESGGLRFVWLRQAEEEKCGPRAGTLGGSPAYLNVRSAASPPCPRGHLPLLCPADFTLHPIRSPNSDFEPKRGQACLGPDFRQQATWLSPKQLQVGIAVSGEEIPPGTIRGEVKLSEVTPRLGFGHAMTLTLPHGHLGYRTI